MTGGYTQMPTVTVKVYPPPELAEQVAQYADDHDMSVSAAWKNLARRGLQQEAADQ